MSPVVAEAGFEHRAQGRGMEFRTGADGQLRLSGYASVFGVVYDCYAFEEEIDRRAFDETLAAGPDVVLVINHAAGGQLPIARTTSGTMRLSADTVGLKVDADLDPADPDVKALQGKAARGDVGGMSFAFQALESAWNEDFTKRTVMRANIDGGDVSCVNFGANPDAWFDMRSRAMRSAGSGLSNRRHATGPVSISTAEARARVMILRGGR